MRYFFYRHRNRYQLSRYINRIEYYDELNHQKYDKIKRNQYNKIIINKRGRTMTKKFYRKRDLSSDPFYPKQNYNKIHRSNRITPFSWIKYCNLTNRIDSKNINLIIMKEQINFSQEDN